MSEVSYKIREKRLLKITRYSNTLRDDIVDRKRSQSGRHGIQILVVLILV
jgi:hypothetical protein